MLQISRILYPTDFSPCARQALTHALFLGEQFGSELHMLHAVVLHDYDPNEPQHRFPEPEEIIKRMFANADSEMSRLLEEHAQRPLTIKEASRRGFRTAEVILDYALESEIELIVMGTHGRSRAAHFLLGSVAEEVVRLARCPVLTLREQEAPPTVEEIERVLVPIDFSRYSQNALGFAKEIAVAYDARLQVLHVIDDPPHPHYYGPTGGYSLSGRLAELQETVGEGLHRAVAEASGPEVEYDTYVINGRPANRIAAFAESEKTDMVVIATHGLSGIERMLLGSTAEQVVRMAPCPVLTVKAELDEADDDQ